MLGKRARPLQRSTSKMQLLSDNNYVSSIANDSMHHGKHEVLKPFNVGAPRQVIGFNPVKKDLDAGQSPVPGIAIKGYETRSARSPRSGLESLLSNHSPSEKRAREGTAVGIKGEDDVAKHPAVASPKALVAIAGKQQECCPKQSEPICISLTYGKQFRSEGMHSDEDDSFNEFDVATFRGLRYFTSRTEVKKACESIFSTASPASSCGEINSGLLPDMDFLSSCYLCKRHLGLGKDIYMYRGDRAFCSVECRFQHIAFDERIVWYSASVPASRSRLFAASPVAAA